MRSPPPALPLGGGCGLSLLSLWRAPGAPSAAPAAAGWAAPVVRRVVWGVCRGFLFGFVACVCGVAGWFGAVCALVASARGFCAVGWCRALAFASVLAGVFGCRGRRRVFVLWLCGGVCGGVVGLVRFSGGGFAACWCVRSCLGGFGAGGAACGGGRRCAGCAGALSVGLGSWGLAWSFLCWWPALRAAGLGGWCAVLAGFWRFAVRLLRSRRCCVAVRGLLAWRRAAFPLGSFCCRVRVSRRFLMQHGAVLVLRRSFARKLQLFISFGFFSA